MNETSIVKLRLSSEARLLEEKKDQYRKKSAIVLILHHLEKNGYIQAFHSLEQESGVSYSRFSVADNVDLLYILQEFETYQKIKYNREVKLIRALQTNAVPHSSKLSTVSTYPSNTPLSTTKLLVKELNKDLQKPRKLHPIQQAYQKLGQSSSSTSRSNVDLASKSTLDGEIPPLEMLGTSLQAPNTNPTSSPQEESTETLKHSSDSEETLFLPPLLKSPVYPSHTELKDLSSLIFREIITKSPNVPFDSIVGLEDAKRIVKEAVVFPILYPELSHDQCSRVLLYGPPGTGKTTLAKAIATECHTTFFHISASSIVSKWRGESEKLVRILFETAKQHAPSTIFIDEVESLLSQRTSNDNGDHEGSRRMKSELLLQLDGLFSSVQEENPHVFFLAATNMPWELDLALLRRLEKRIFVNLPSLDARKNMLIQFLPSDSKDGFGHPLISTLDYSELALRTKGYSGADLRLIAKEALMVPLRRILTQLELSSSLKNDRYVRDPVCMNDVLKALETTKPSVDHRWTSKYEEWEKSFGNN